MDADELPELIVVLYDQHVFQCATSGKCIFKVAWRNAVLGFAFHSIPGM
jgi:hypothetical protein